MCSPTSPRLRRESIPVGTSLDMSPLSRSAIFVSPVVDMNANPVLLSVISTGVAQLVQSERGNDPPSEVPYRLKSNWLLSNVVPDPE